MITTDTSLNWPTLIALAGGVVGVWRLLKCMKTDIKSEIVGLGKELKTDVRTLQIAMHNMNGRLGRVEGLVESFTRK